MAQLFANAARAPLFTGVNGTATQIEVLQDGGLFPTVAAPDWFRGVLQDENGIEVVRVTAHAAGSNIFTIERGQEGTTARPFAAGSAFGLRMTAADLQGFLAQAATLTSDVATLTSDVATLTSDVATLTTSKADANTVVTLTGNQTIAGTKTFSSPTVAAGFYNSGAFYKNASIVSTNTTIPSGENWMSVGPVEIASGTAVTVDGEWVIV